SALRRQRRRTDFRRHQDDRCTPSKLPTSKITLCRVGSRRTKSFWTFSSNALVSLVDSALLPPFSTRNPGSALHQIICAQRLGPFRSSPGIRKRSHLTATVKISFSSDRTASVHT